MKTVKKAKCVRFLRLSQHQMAMVAFSISVCSFKLILTYFGFISRLTN